MPSDLSAVLITGAALRHPLDALFVNAPLRDYAERPRVNDFTLPVLGMGYLATYATAQGFNVGVLDAEAHGLGIGHTIDVVNRAAPRWVGFNLLAPTYQVSARIAAAVAPAIKVMLGGHQAKATPVEILADPRMSRCEALVLGEGETRVAALLADYRSCTELPGVMWLDPILKTPVTGDVLGNSHHLAPDVDALPFVDRRYLTQDPHHEAGRWVSFPGSPEGLVFPWFSRVGLLNSCAARSQEGGMGRRGYSPEFRRKVVDLVDAGRTVAEVARDLSISDQSIYAWRR